MKIVHSLSSLVRAGNLLLLAMACTVLYGCHDTTNADDRRIIVSILPLKYVVKQITGDDFPVEVLVPPGSSPETYEPTPAQMMAVTDAKMILVTGLIDFERQLAERIGQQSAPAKLCDLSQGIDLIEGECGHGGHAGHGVDPHIWSSPRNLKIMAATAYRSIALLYPDSTAYRDNYERFVGRLDSLYTTIAQTLACCRSDYFIIYHPALTYYARDYGLRQVALEHEGKEPSAERLKQVIAQARRDSITCIFYQKQFSPATVEAMAREIGGRCVQIDPLREDVDVNLLQITRLIASQ